MRVESAFAGECGHMLLELCESSFLRFFVCISYVKCVCFAVATFAGE